MAKTLSVFNSRMQKFPVLCFVCGIFLCMALGYIDHRTDPGLNFAFFYLIPVFWVAWNSGLIPGLGVAAVSVVSWIVTEQQSLPANTQGFPLLWNAFMLAGFLSMVVYVANALAQAMNREQELARHDRLTAAYNAKAFYGILQVESHRCRRYNRPLTIAYINCDDMRKVNNRQGYHRGDELLRLTSDMVRQGLRITDTFARLSGDEFAVILPETHNRDAKNIFLRIRKALSDHLLIQESKLTYSIGVATFLNPPETLDQMVAKAQMLMKDVKANGKNMVNAEVVGASKIEKA